MRQPTLPLGMVADFLHLEDDKSKLESAAKLKYQDNLEDLKEIIDFNREKLVSLSQEKKDLDLDKEEKFNKIKTRSARYLSTRPAMYTAIVTALGDDSAATMAGLLRNVSEGVLNFANASEEAFKGFLKFILKLITLFAPNIANKWLLVIK